MAEWKSGTLHPGPLTNIRYDYDLKIKVNDAIGVVRIIYFYVGRYNTEMREESSKGEMEDPMGNLLIKGMTS
jgi:hypothetical protein